MYGTCETPCYMYRLILRALIKPDIEQLAELPMENDSSYSGD